MWYSSTAKNGLWCAFFFLLAMPACTSPPGEKEAGAGKLTVAVAANVQFAMAELKAAFEKESGLSVNVAVSSSGKLATQILQGAPYSLLASADMKYPAALLERGKAANAPRVYAYGALVLWTMKDDIELLADPAFLLGDSIRKVAIANPRNAPYGEQAIRYFEHYGLLDAIRSKLTYGESIAQTNQYIISKAVEAGITAKSVVLSPEMKNTGKWVELPPDSYQPIEQGVVITSYGQEKHPQASQRFYEFLFSEKARAIFERYGYQLPD